MDHSLRKFTIFRLIYVRYAGPIHSLFSCPHVFQLGSWEGDIRIWKIDAKLNSFSLVGKISAPGVVNSLQLLTMPKGFLKTIAWGSSLSQAAEPTSQATKKELAAQPFLLVAGLGQEHKLGRWLTVKEGGAVNQAVVIVFSPLSIIPEL